MNILRNSCTGRRPVHFFRKLGGVAAALMLAAASLSPADAARKPVQAPAQAQPAPAKPQPSGQGVADFYRARGDAPLWLAPRAGDAAEQLLALLSTANLDGLYPEKYQADRLRAAIAAARGGNARALKDAEEQLSNAFVAYVGDLVRDPNIGIIYVDPQLRPKPPSPLAALLNAASAPSLAEYVRGLGWMHPFYRQLRETLAEGRYANEHERQLLTVNLERARALPAGQGRYILVNSAQQRLYMYEGGKVVDSMRVVVGKPKYATPMMTAYVRFASLNPYWFVPPDLAAERIAPNVVRRGLKYLNDLGYKVLTDWDENPEIIDPSTIDWKAVAEGKIEVRIRQQPGPHNSMGRMKFMFPNHAGIYLHDNPERELFEQAARLYSGGCVRLEDAPRLGRWLFGHDLDWQTATTEQHVPLPSLVPVYIAYLTAVPDGSAIAYYEDVYGRDAARLAAMEAAAASSAAAAPGR